MADEMTLFTQDPNTEEYVPYEPPAPPTFIETLPEDIRENEHVKKFNDSGEMAKSYIDLANQRSTIPEKPDDYQFTPPDDYPIDADRLNNWKSTFHGLQLTQDQFSGVLEAALKEEQHSMDEINADITKNREESINALKTDWGTKYEENLDTTKKIWNEISEGMGEHGKEARQFMEDTKLGDNIHFLRMMHYLSTIIGEDKLVIGSPKSRQTELGRTDSGNIVYDDYPEMRKK